MTDNSTLIPILYQALGARIGLLLRVDDFARARQRLYAARREALDETLMRLQFRSWSGEGGNLVIVKAAEQTQKQTPEQSEW